MSLLSAFAKVGQPQSTSPSTQPPNSSPSSPATSSKPLSVNPSLDNTNNGNNNNYNAASPNSQNNENIDIEVEHTKKEKKKKHKEHKEKKSKDKKKKKHKELESSPKGDNRLLPLDNAPEIKPRAPSPNPHTSRRKSLTDRLEPLDHHPSNSNNNNNNHPQYESKMNNQLEPLNHTSSGNTLSTITNAQTHPRGRTPPKQSSSFLYNSDPRLLSGSTTSSYDESEYAQLMRKDEENRLKEEQNAQNLLVSSRRHKIGEQATPTMKLDNGDNTTDYIPKTGRKSGYNTSRSRNKSSSRKYENDDFEKEMEAEFGSSNKNNVNSPPPRRDSQGVYHHSNTSKSSKKYADHDDDDEVVLVSPNHKPSHKKSSSPERTSSVSPSKKIPSSSTSPSATKTPTMHLSSNKKSTSSSPPKAVNASSSPRSQYASELEKRLQEQMELEHAAEEEKQWAEQEAEYIRLEKERLKQEENNRIQAEKNRVEEEKRKLQLAAEERIRIEKRRQEDVFKAAEEARLRAEEEEKRRAAEEARRIAEMKEEEEKELMSHTKEWNDQQPPQPTPLTQPLPLQSLFSSLFLPSLTFQKNKPLKDEKESNNHPHSPTSINTNVPTGVKLDGSSLPTTVVFEEGVPTHVFFCSADNKIHSSPWTSSSRAPTLLLFHPFCVPPLPDFVRRHRRQQRAKQRRLEWETLEKMAVQQRQDYTRISKPTFNFNTADVDRHRRQLEETDKKLALLQAKHKKEEELEEKLASLEVEENDDPDAAMATRPPNPLQKIAYLAFLDSSAEPPHRPHGETLTLLQLRHLFGLDRDEKSLCMLRKQHPGWSPPSPEDGCFYVQKLIMNRGKHHFVMKVDYVSANGVENEEREKAEQANEVFHPLDVYKPKISLARRVSKTPFSPALGFVAQTQLHTYFSNSDVFKGEIGVPMELNEFSFETSLKDPNDIRRFTHCCKILAGKIEELVEDHTRNDVTEETEYMSDEEKEDHKVKKYVKKFTCYFQPCVDGKWYVLALRGLELLSGQSKAQLNASTLVIDQDDDALAEKQLIEDLEREQEEARLKHALADARQRQAMEMESKATTASESAAAAAVFEAAKAVAPPPNPSNLVPGTASAREVLKQRALQGHKRIDQNRCCKCHSLFKPPNEESKGKNRRGEKQMVMLRQILLKWIPSRFYEYPEDLFLDLMGVDKETNNPDWIRTMVPVCHDCLDEIRALRTIPQRTQLAPWLQQRPEAIADMERRQELLAKHQQKLFTRTSSRKKSPVISATSTPIVGDDDNTATITSSKPFVPSQRDMDEIPPASAPVLLPYLSRATLLHSPGVGHADEVVPGPANVQKNSQNIANVTDSYQGSGGLALSPDQERLLAPRDKRELMDAEKEQQILRKQRNTARPAVDTHRAKSYNMSNTRKTARGRLNSRSNSYSPTRSWESVPLSEYYTSPSIGKSVVAGGSGLSPSKSHFPGQVTVGSPQHLAQTLDSLLPSPKQVNNAYGTTPAGPITSRSKYISNNNNNKPLTARSRSLSRNGLPSQRTERSLFIHSSRARAASEKRSTGRYTSMGVPSARLSLTQRNTNRGVKSLPSSRATSRARLTRDESYTPLTKKPSVPRASEASPLPPHLNHLKDRKPKRNTTLGDQLAADALLTRAQRRKKELEPSPYDAPVQGYQRVVKRHPRTGSPPSHHVKPIDPDRFKKKKSSNINRMGRPDEKLAYEAAMKTKNKQINLKHMQVPNASSRFPRSTNHAGAIIPHPVIEVDTMNQSQLTTRQQQKEQEKELLARRAMEIAQAHTKAQQLAAKKNGKTLAEKKHEADMMLQLRREYQRIADERRRQKEEIEEINRQRLEEKAQEEEYLNKLKQEEQEYYNNNKNMPYQNNSPKKTKSTHSIINGATSNIPSPDNTKNRKTVNNAPANTNTTTTNNNNNNNNNNSNNSSSDNNTNNGNKKPISEESTQDYEDDFDTTDNSARNTKSSSTVSTNNIQSPATIKEEKKQETPVQTSNNNSSSVPASSPNELALNRPTTQTIVKDSDFPSISSPAKDTYNNNNSSINNSNPVKSTASNTVVESKPQQVSSQPIVTPSPAKKEVLSSQPSESAKQSTTTTNSPANKQTSTMFGAFTRDDNVNNKTSTTSSTKTPSVSDSSSSSTGYVPSRRGVTDNNKSSNSNKVEQNKPINIKSEEDVYADDFDLGFDD